MADDRPDLPHDASQDGSLGRDPAAEIAALYDTDVLAWSELQAAALRARRAGEVVLDWDNLAEEIEDVGKSEYWACESQVENIVEHLAKLEFVASPRDRPHWRGETRTFRRTLRKRLTRTIENRVREGLDALQFDLVKGLLDRKLAGLDEEAATLMRLRPYTWAQITDEDWFPEPHHG